MLHSFSGTDGANPYAGLVLDAAGNLYGTTYSGGTSTVYGTVFEITGAPPVPLSIRHRSSLPAGRYAAEHGGMARFRAAPSRTFPIPQEGGCNIPATAAAYSLNVTVVPMGRLGYLTMWPAGIDLQTCGFHPELAGWPRQGQRGDCAGGHQRSGQYLRHRHDQCDPRHQWLLRAGFVVPRWSSIRCHPVASPTRATAAYPPGLGPPSLTGGQRTRISPY